jgi:hypothetical protein
MTFTTTPEVERYLAAVREELRDLPDGEREDLLRDVEASLAEAAEDGEGPLEDRLGPATAFAVELRASAGLPPAPVGAPLHRPTLRERLAELAQSSRARTVGRVARELAPIWWLARGYVVIWVLAKLLGADWSTSHPAVPRLSSGGWGAFAIVAACAASIAWGLYWRRRGGARTVLVVALNLLLLVLALPALGRAVTAAESRTVFVSDGVVQPVVTARQPIVKIATFAAAPVQGGTARWAVALTLRNVGQAPGLVVRVRLAAGGGVIRQWTIKQIAPGHAAPLIWRGRLQRTSAPLRTFTVTVPGYGSSAFTVPAQTRR